jgi:hypothetical protein
MAITPSLRQTLGLAALEIRLSTPTAASGTSYHAEVVIPEELRAVRAALVDEQGHEHDAEDNVDRVALYGARIPPGRGRPCASGCVPSARAFPTPRRRSPSSCACCWPRAGGSPTSIQRSPGRR